MFLIIIIALVIFVFGCIWNGLALSQMKTPRVHMNQVTYSMLVGMAHYVIAILLYMFVHFAKVDVLGKL
jgi:TRAP-type C4-dicarboxylate transport system permease small subunit